MHRSALIAKTMLYFIKMLPTGCSMVSLNSSIYATLSISNANHSMLFIDEEYHTVSFMRYPGIVEMVSSYFQDRQDLAGIADYQNHKNEIHDIVAMHLYCVCDQLMFDLEEDGRPPDKTILELRKHLSKYQLKEINISGSKMRYTPGKAFKFFNNYCETEILDLSETNINVVELDNAELHNIKVLFLNEIGLAQLPCLSGFVNLRSLYLNGNNIRKLEPESFFDEITGSYKTMPTLENIYLWSNPINEVDLKIQWVFTHKSIIVSLDNLDLGLKSKRQRAVTSKKE